MILLAGFCLLLIAAIPYLVYVVGINFGRRLPDLEIPKDFPDISIIISAYNEASVIARRIDNLSKINYPKENIEIILIDDCSSDNTLQIAENELETKNITYTLIHNEKRLGVNRSYNKGIKRAKYDIVITTDADVFFEENAIFFIITRLLSDVQIAAVCGDLQPESSSLGKRTGKMEGIYRNFYGRMCEWESAIDATYNFNGALIAFNKNIIGRIEESKGADDANTAFNAIKQGFRSVYEIQAKVREDIPPSITKQYKQKIRRATGLIEATLLNLTLLKYNRPFSRIFFPLRIWMYIFSPLIFFVSVIMIFFGLYLLNLALFLIPLSAFILILLHQRNFISTFIFNQFFLLIGLAQLRKDITLWESTSQKG